MGVGHVDRDTGSISATVTFFTTPLFGLTLIHMQRENGRVATIRRTESKAKRRAQHPGPSGSAESKRSIKGHEGYKGQQRWLWL